MTEGESTGTTYTIAGVHVPFPLRAYPCQVSVMERVITAASNQENALLESPTGTGKTLALLASSIAWMNHPNPPNPSSSLESPPDSENRTPLAKHHHVIYATRTHSQLSQVVGELKRVHGTFTSSVLGSRDHMCALDRRIFGEGVNVDEGCMQALESRSCSYVHNSGKVVEKLETVVWDIEDIVTVGRKVGGCPFYASRDLMKQADVLLCPYNYLLDPVIRDSMNIPIKSALIIFDEAHNIEDVCREAISLYMTRTTILKFATECDNLGQRGVLPEDHFGIRDMMRTIGEVMDHAKAHGNQASVWGEEQTDTWNGTQLLALLEAMNVDRDRLLAFSIHVSEAAELVRIVQKEKKGNKPISHPILSFRKKQKLEDQAPHFPQCLSTRTLTSLQRVDLILRYLFKDPKDFCLVLTSSTQGSKESKGSEGSKGSKESKESKTSKPSKTFKGFKTPEEPKRFSPFPRCPPPCAAVQDFRMEIKCLNPALAFRDISKQTHSVVLASGTLSPMDTFRSELGCTFPKTLEARHVIEKDQVQCLCLPKGVKGRHLTSSFQTRNDVSMMDDLGETLIGLVQAIPHGMLFFFPSYQKLDSVLSRWKENGIYQRIEGHKRLFFEPRQAHAFDGVMQTYDAHITRSVKGTSKGAIMFAVFRGKVSEGMDFADEKARAVVCYGIPFPNVKDAGVAKKKEYNDNERGTGKLSGAEWYRQQAFRALNQAVGRCIRHRNDFGAIIFLEERMADPGSTNALSKWLRENVQVWRSAPDAIAFLSRYFEAKKSEREMYVHDR